VTENEEPDLLALKSLVESGDSVVDIGANIGVYAKYLSGLVGSVGHVISVEPIPSTFDILCSNVRKLGLSNVEVKNCAISDAEGKLKMRVPKYDSGGENFYCACIDSEGTDDGARSFVVPATTVDLLLSTMPAVHFIKCDVEGHELHCIRGARNTIERFKPAWLIEISGDMNDVRSGAYQTFCILKDCGYEAYWFDGTRLRLRRPDAKSVNYFFLTSSQVERLRGKGFRVDA
jgi:FkbM family methyltransferase